MHLFLPFHFIIALFKPQKHAKRKINSKLARILRARAQNKKKMRRKTAENIDLTLFAFYNAQQNIL